MCYLFTNTLIVQIKLILKAKIFDFFIFRLFLENELIMQNQGHIRNQRIDIDQNIGISALKPATSFL